MCGIDGTPRLLRLAAWLMNGRSASPVATGDQAMPVRRRCSSRLGLLRRLR